MLQNSSLPDTPPKSTAQPTDTSNSVKPINVLRFDLDTVQDYGLKAARFITYLECWLRGKVTRDPNTPQFTYDAAHIICGRTGLKPATFERIVKLLRKAQFIRVKPGRKNMRCYSFSDQTSYFKSRNECKHVYALRSDADLHGEPVSIILYNWRYWIKHNKERQRLFAGRFWRYESLKELTSLQAGFLTYAQISDAVRYMHDNKVIDVIAFYDKEGVRHDDKFWVTLLEVPKVDDSEPDNHVRPASLFTPQGSKIQSGVTCNIEPCTLDKTESDNDKTPLANDRFPDAANTAHSIAHQNVTPCPARPLIEDYLIVPSEVADAPSNCTQVRLSSNLPVSDEPARPPASRKPTASSADSPTTGRTFQSLELRLQQLEKSSAEVTRLVQQMNLNLHLIKAEPRDRDGKLQMQSELLLRIPQAERRKFLFQFKGDQEAAHKAQQRSSAIELGPIKEQLRQLNFSRIPLECFGHRFGDPRLNCQRCLWPKSCELATPPETKSSIQAIASINSPTWNFQYASDRPINVGETYLAVYTEVFGVTAPDTVGRFATIYNNTRTLKIPVRLYCLVYMTLWANLHPLQKFYSKYLATAHAFESVGMVLDLCSKKFAVVLEDRLGMILQLQFIDGKPCWRHQATPVEVFLEGWLKAMTERGLQKAMPKWSEIRDLTYYMRNMDFLDADKLLNTVLSWLCDATGEYSLGHFLCNVQGLPAPISEPPDEPAKPWYEKYIDEEEGEYDEKRTRAYWEAIDREKKATSAAQPDSGAEFIDILLRRTGAVQSH